LNLIDLPREMVDAIISFADKKSLFELREVCHATKQHVDSSAKNPTRKPSVGFMIKELKEPIDDVLFELTLWVECKIFLIPVMRYFKSLSYMGRYAELPKEKLMDLIDLMAEMLRGCSVNYLLISFEQ
ncbi:hypothetical protein PFISCL1PPCAC_534, partial [Pristionchus fissidentatus]